MLQKNTVVESLRGLRTQEKIMIHPCDATFEKGCCHTSGWCEISGHSVRFSSINIKSQVTQWNRGIMMAIFSLPHMYCLWEHNCDSLLALLVLSK